MNRSHEHGSWAHFEHGADIGIVGSGRDLPMAFAQAALALTAIVTDPGNVRSEVMVEVDVQAPDDELLLVEWLNAVIYEMATRGMVFGRYDVDVRDHTLAGQLWGEAVNVLRHEPAVEVKGATLTALKADKRGDGTFVAQCVVDV